MKIIIISVITILLNTLCLGQSKQKDIEVNNELDSSAVKKIIYFLGVDYQKYSISERFKDNYCNIIIEEYKNGEKKETKNLRIDVKKYEHVLYIGNNLEDSLFNLEFISQIVSDSLLKLKIGVGGLGYNAKLKLVDSLHYTWKELTNINIKNFKILDNTLPLLTFTSAIGKKFTNYKGDFEFCRINNEIIPYQDWYIKLGIEHFYIFIVRFEKK